MLAPSYRVAVNPHGEPAPGNVILRAALAGDYHVRAYTTPLSLKSVTRGVSFYGTPRTRYRIDEHAVVVLNAGQTYSMEIDARDRTGTLCVFFEPGFVEGVARAMRRGERSLLEPEEPHGALELAERLHPKSGGIARRLLALEASLATGRAEARLEEELFGLAEEIVVLEGRARHDAAGFPGVRAATREEAYRRLHWARDYLDASFDEPLNVGILAKVACMSPYHFQRLFKRAFGETPMHRVQRRRLAEAARRLRTTDAPVTRICLEVGFESLGTFSTLFARAFGASPRSYRQKSRIEEVRRA
jgi:AraC-like DNA-binding protein